MKASLLLPMVAASLATSIFTAAADDWPRYRGPHGDGVAEASLAVKSFSENGPPQVWKAETPLGFSSFAVVDDKAVTLVAAEHEGNPMELCRALDASSGKTLWETPLWISDYKHGGGNAGEDDNKGGDGPRSTPTIDGDRVYIYDAHLRLYCLDLDDGEMVWKKDLVKEHGAQNIKWLNAISPVIDGDRLFVAAGGRNQSLLAFDKDDGELLWKGESDAITHATPVVAEIHGQKQVIFFTQEGLVSVEPEEGEVLWRYEFPFNVSTAASPVVWEDIVYCSAGYGVGAGAVQIKKAGDGFTAEEIYRKENETVNHWSTPVVRDGYLYGMFSFKEYGKGPIACVDIRTGKQKWAQPGFGPGNVILSADGTLIALSDKGELVLAKASPDGYEELARADLLEGKCWSTPALADGKVFIRSTVEGACFDLSAVSAR